MSLKEKIRVVPDYPKQGIRFLDVTTLFQDADGFAELIERMKQKLEGIEVDMVVGPEARGFVLGATLAYAVHAGFVPARKPNRLPCETVKCDFSYGHSVETLEMHKDAIKPGQKVVVVDDLLGTVSTALAACRLVEKLGGEVTAVLFAMENTMLDGIKNLAAYHVETIIKF